MGNNVKKGMKKLVVILVIMFIFGIIIPVLATESTIKANEYIKIDDLKGLPIGTRNDIIDKKIKDLDKAKGLVDESKEIVSNLDPDEAQKWAKLITGSIRTICKDLSIEVNEFVKTDVGKITMALIVYKVVGDDVIGTFFGCLGWLVITFILALSFRYFHGSDKLVIKDENKQIIDIKHVPRYEWKPDSSDGGYYTKISSAVIHVAIFCVTSIITLCLVAAH